MFRFASLMTFVLAAFAVGSLKAVPATDRLALARGLVERGFDLDARKELEGLVGDPTVPQDEVVFRLGDLDRKAERKTDAIARFDDLVARFPASRYVDHARLGKALCLVGAERRRALEALDVASTAAAVRNAARSALAPEYAASSDPALRRKAMSTYLDLAASKDAAVAEDGLYFAALLAYRDARHAESAALFARLFAKAPDGVRAREARKPAAWASFLAGRHAEALALATPLRDAADEDGLYLVAASLRLLERRDEAMAAYDAALKRHPAGAYAEAEWFERLSMIFAAGEHRRVLAQISGHGEWSRKYSARAHAYALESAFALGEWKKTVEMAALVVRERDANTAPRALFLAAAAHSRLGKGKDAVKAWTELVTDWPDSPLAADSLRARALEELRLQDWRAARRSFDDLERRFPARLADAETLYWRGVALARAEDAPEAEKALRAALAARPAPEIAREVELELAQLERKRGAIRDSARRFAAVAKTAAADRLAPETLEWSARALLVDGDATAAAGLAELLEKRQCDESWTQIAAALLGRARETLGQTDAAEAAYVRALAAKAATDEGARAALALGRIESAAGKFDAAKARLENAVERANSRELASVRMEAYAALGRNEESRGDAKAALGFYMLAGTLFDDDRVVPACLDRAVELLRRDGRNREADELAAERQRRHPDRKEKGK